MPTSDELNTQVRSLLDKSGAGKVAANLFIDPNNPCWNALREAARKNPNYVDPAARAKYMLAQLDNETGSLGLVLNPRGVQVIERENGKTITHIPPHSFASQEQADLWLALNASPRFRYLLMVAKADYPELAGVDHDVVPEPSGVVELFTKHGYTLVTANVPAVATSAERTGGFRVVWPLTVIADKTVAELTQLGFFDRLNIRFTEDGQKIVPFHGGEVTDSDLIVYKIERGDFPVQFLWNGYGGVPLISLRGMTWKQIIDALELA